MRNLVLLGAGASKGSEFVEPHVPPLGCELFHVLEQMGGVTAGLPDHMKQIFRQNFEAGMDELAMQDSRLLLVFQKELGRYLIQFEAGDGNLYTELETAFAGAEVTYSTLNYDIIFETATGIFNCDPDSRGSPLLLKLHGSVDFWPNLPDSLIADNNQWIRGPLSPVHFDIMDAPIIKWPPIFARMLYESRTIGPAIASYARGKPARLCRNFLRRVQERWREELRKADSVHVIGTSVVRQDKHIWDRSGEAPGTLRYFGHLSSDCEKFLEWAARERFGPSECFQSTFADAIRNIREHVYRRAADR